MKAVFYPITCYSLLIIRLRAVCEYLQPEKEIFNEKKGN